MTQPKAKQPKAKSRIVCGKCFKFRNKCTCKVPMIIGRLTKTELESLKDKTPLTPQDYIMSKMEDNPEKWKGLIHMIPSDWFKHMKEYAEYIKQFTSKP